MKIVVGLGNPESKYDRTRHNVGFMALEWLKDEYAVAFIEQKAFKSLVATAQREGDKVLLVKPTTYYNESGTAVRAIMNFYKVSPEDILVIHDELALPLGTIRIRQGGSDAGNNGIKSLNTHVGQETARLRIGVANETHAALDKIDVVLGKFNESEMKKLQAMKPAIFDIVEQFIRGNHEITTYKH